MNEAIASLIDRSELIDSTLIPYFASGRRRLGCDFPLCEYNTPYIDCDLFKYGFQEMTGDDN